MALGTSILLALIAAFLWLVYTEKLTAFLRFLGWLISGDEKPIDPQIKEDFSYLANKKPSQTNIKKSYPMKKLLNLLNDHLKENVIIKITSIAMLALFLFPPYTVEAPNSLHGLLSTGRCFILSTPAYKPEFHNALYGHINSTDMLAQVIAVGLIGLLAHKFLGSNK
jgi:hypothetical protein